jgi:hypothetical protein
LYTTSSGSVSVSIDEPPPATHSFVEGFATLTDLFAPFESLVPSFGDETPFFVAPPFTGIDEGAYFEFFDAVFTFAREIGEIGHEVETIPQVFQFGEALCIGTVVAAQSKPCYFMKGINYVFNLAEQFTINPTYQIFDVDIELALIDYDELVLELLN